MSTSPTERRSKRPSNRFRRWFFEGIRDSKKSAAHHQDKWWKVMCLTGVDYFSTLGYQPGIAFMAAGILSPLATLVVVLVTLFGLVPLYSRVARESPFGQGSIAMLENLVPGWKGKAFVLVLLGFAATDFVITITLSAADATAHIVENPLVPPGMHDKVGVTIAILAVLGGVFLKGYREAIGLSVLIVAVYLVLNAWVVVVSGQQIAAHPSLLNDWLAKINSAFPNVMAMLGTSLILFPKLALGMSGFETGVAVMPLVKGDANDVPDEPAGRIKNTRKLLLTAALIMAAALLSTSIVTTVLIPEAAFKHGGEADGRALAYLAHKYLGAGVGTAYDISTILILWFAGASALAGLLNLVPRYLPRYGMAPEWARAVRPLVVFFTLVTFAVTIIFKADVDAQAGAYATGVLVLFTSAAVAVVLTVWKESVVKRVGFLTIMCVFIYTSIANMIERPEGLHIASFFIAAILAVSLISRGIRSLELRVSSVRMDETAHRFMEEAMQSKLGEIRILAHRPGGSDYKTKEQESRETHSITLPEGDFIFLEVGLLDPSEFEYDLVVEGKEEDGYKILRCTAHAIPNAIAALLLHIRDQTGRIPHAYFGWTEGNPLLYILKYIFLGEGETAPLTREILRQTVPDSKRRPRVHVG
ncbi:MAG TPA: hypothetical protein V6D17_17070 [Candidatus Obscuribacterales bacterium]